jgi:NADH:ubiquinone oxidoreductase subunit F (NADH-binding)
VFDIHSDPWHEILQALTYAAGESAGQCGPCMRGLPALLAELTSVRRPDSSGGLDRFELLLAQLAGRGACHFPDGVARFVTSAFEVFGTALSVTRNPDDIPLTPETRR